MAHNINSLDSSDGKAKVKTPKVKGSILLSDRILFLIIENFELLEKEFYPRGVLTLDLDLGASLKKIFNLWQKSTSNLCMLNIMKHALYYAWLRDKI